jgi:hypothetical protein
MKVARGWTTNQCRKFASKTTEVPTMKPIRQANEAGIAFFHNVNDVPINPPPTIPTSVAGMAPKANIQGATNKRNERKPNMLSATFGYPCVVKTPGEDQAPDVDIYTLKANMYEQADQNAIIEPTLMPSITKTFKRFKLDIGSILLR